MRRKKAMSVKEDVQCNLIPMVDIMFLLLLFFILGADMTQRETEDLVLPTADKAIEYPKVKDETPTTIVNVHHRPSSRNFSCATHSAGHICREIDHWLITIRRQDYTWEAAEAQLKTEGAQDMETEVDTTANVRLSKRKVIIRSDGAAPFVCIRKMIELCSRAKIYKIEVGAARPPAT